MIKKTGFLKNCVLMNCGLCGKECGKQYPCEGCWVLFYCCEKHRKLHLRHFHQDECHRLAKQKNRVRILHPITLSHSFQSRSFHLQDCVIVV